MEYELIHAGTLGSLMATATVENTSAPAVDSDAERPPSEHFAFEVFYDGDCPLCRREIDLLRRWDKRSNVRFTDIASPGFDTADVGVDMSTLMAEIHGRLPSGEIVVGVEVFRRLYAAIGLGWLVAPTRWPGVRQSLDVCYRFFAKHRLRLTGRCDTDGACDIKG